MKTRRLGNSDLYPSVVTLGSWQFAGAGGLHPNSLYGEMDEKEAIQTIHAAIDSGINMIDTAPCYGCGHSEEIIGKALKGNALRDKVYIATKVGLMLHNGIYFKRVAPDYIRYNLEESLRYLDTDYVDLLQIHWPDLNNPIEPAIECMKDLVKEGKIRAFGVSNFSVAQLTEAKNAGPLASSQPPLSIVNRESLSTTIPFCAENNIGVLTYATLSGGLLTGKVKNPKEVSGNRGWYKYYNEPHFTSLQSLIAVLKTIADAHNCSVSEVSANWCIMQKGVTSVIVGASRVEQAVANSKFGEWELSAEELAMIEKAYDELLK